MAEEAASLLRNRRLWRRIIGRLFPVGFIHLRLKRVEFKLQDGELLLKFFYAFLGFRAVFTAAQVMTAFRDDTLRSRSLSPLSYR